MNTSTENPITKNGSESPQFPTHPPAQMPCPHWNHFPIHPESPTTPTTPPPFSYNYCNKCKCKENNCTNATECRIKHVCSCGCQLFEMKGGGAIGDKAKKN